MDNRQRAAEAVPSADEVVLKSSSELWRLIEERRAEPTLSA